jgi:SAM-dependent methyltransferase
MADGPTNRYSVPDDQVELEQRRLRLLGVARDPWTFATLDRGGVAAGDVCLEVGAGAGTVTAFLAERVGAAGSVLATDIDIQFHAEPAANVTLLQHDIVNEALPRADFDLVHARAVLQHIPEREAVVDTLIAALRPGGTLVIEESDFRAFEAQPLPEPYETVHRLMNDPAFTPWREPNFGTRLPSLLAARGLVDIEVTGQSWAMRPGEAAGDWWFLAVERVLPTLLAAGMIDDAAMDAVREITTDSGFVMLSPLSLAVSARVPSTES